MSSAAHQALTPASVATAARLLEKAAATRVRVLLVRRKSEMVNVTLVAKKQDTSADFRLFSDRICFQGSLEDGMVVFGADPAVMRNDEGQHQIDGQGSILITGLRPHSLLNKMISKLDL